MEEKNKRKEEIEGKDDKTQQLSLQQVDFINQLTNANEEIMNLRSENERLQNDLNFERQTNERMMKSQVDMNQLNEQSHHRQKGKSRIGYLEESESSQQGAQKNQRPTCSHCGKIGHTSNRCWSNGKEKFNGKCYNCNQYGHRANECKEKPKLVQMSLLWQIWTHWNEQWKKSHEEKKHYQEILYLYRTWSSCK